MTKVKALTEDDLVDVPEWFLLGGWDRCPIGWRHIPAYGVPYAYTLLESSLSNRLMVIVTGSEERDGKRWVHVSMSRSAKTPSYSDMCLVKRAFIGDDRMAVQVFPRRSEHVNIHEHCLHLWHCVDGDPTPDFRRNGQI